MKWPYHPTFLNITSGFYIASIGIYILFNYNKLSATHNWGLIAMYGLLAIGCLALLADLLIQLSIRSKKRQNRLGFCLALLIAIALFSL
jgi:hypothetical protein